MDFKRTVRLLIYLLLPLCGWQAAAHPPSALAIDKKRGTLYFSYWGGTWKMDPQEKLERIHRNDLHWLALDEAGRFADTKTDFPKLTPDGSKPALFSFSDYPAAFDTGGRLYFAPWSIGRIRLERMLPDGTREKVVDAPIKPELARKAGRHEGGVVAIAAGLEGRMIVSDGASIWTVSSDGKISLNAGNITVAGCAGDLPAELPKPHIRSMAVGSKGDIYAAATGCRRILRITPSGGITTVLRSESPWTPCAVVESKGDLYVMEYDNALAERPHDGRPRIRKLSHTGEVRILAVMDKAPPKKKR